MYNIKKMYNAETISDAVKFLTDNEDALIIAGGSDVLIELRHGKISNATLVNIRDIEEMQGIELVNDDIIIKPLSTFTEIDENPIIQKHIPMLAEAVSTVGGPQVRNIGTIGGNICNGITSADSASTLFTLDAELEITGPDGKRNINIKDFYIWVGEVDLKPGELLTKIIIKKENYENHFGHYYKYAKRNAMDIAIQGCAVNCKLSTDKTKLENVRIGFGVGGPIPLRCFETEKNAKDKKLSNELIEEIGKSVLLEVNPRTSWKATKEFRLHLAEELSKRVLKEAIERAGGHIND
ncbi:xanthine dehydrogenase FAD-binding subunit XdhB [Mycoplasmatota bacterium zrk1]